MLKPDYLSGLLFAVLALASDAQAQSATQKWALQSLTDLKALNTSIAVAESLGQKAVKVEFTPEVQKRNLGTPPNVPTMALLPAQLKDGVIEVDFAAEDNGEAGADVRGFAGLSFHVSPDEQQWDAIYLRMTNGRLARPTPGEPRIQRAIQYISLPGWDWPVSREKAPGQYEKGANIAPRTWNHLRIELDGNQARAYVNHEAEPALVVKDLKRTNQGGAVGLWVGDGTAAYFRNLVVSPR